VAAAWHSRLENALTSGLCIKHGENSNHSGLFSLAGNESGSLTGGLVLIAAH
jgi:hypothetical protein